jgi:hypothetical protein
MMPIQSHTLAQPSVGIEPTFDPTERVTRIELVSFRLEGESIL